MSEELKKLLSAIDQRTADISQTVNSCDARIRGLEEWRKETLGGPSVRVDSKKERPFSLSRALLGMALHDWKAANAELEGEQIEQYTHDKRALSAGVDSGGGYVIPPQYVSSLIEQLKANSVLMAAGMRMIRGLSSPIQIPRKKSAASASWTAEAGTIAASDPSFEMVTAQPHMVAARTTMSRRVAALSNPDIDAIVRQDLAEELALAVDLAGLRGSGASNQPLGVANTAGIGSVVVGANGGPITYALLVDVVHQLRKANADRGSRYFIMHPDLERQISKLLDVDNRPLFTWDPSQGQPSRTLLGFPYLTSTQIPVNLTKGSGTDLTELYYGNWGDLLEAEWGDMVVEATLEGAGMFETHSISIKAVMELDFIVRIPASFVLMNDLDSGN